MPGVISRDGLILDMPVLSEEVRSRMLDSIVTAYITAHPEELRRQPEQQTKAGA